MWEFGFFPDLMTMTSVISDCEALGDVSLGRALHGYVSRMDFYSDVSVHNSLILLYSTIGNWEEAEKIFDRIQCKDVVSWTAMISGYESNGYPEKAVKTYKMMEQEGVMPDEITIASVLSACTSLGLLEMGVKLQQLAERRGLIAYMIVSNTLIDLYSKCNCIDKALEIFHRIPDKNVISWTSIILGLRINNRSLEALIFFREMTCHQDPNSVTLVSVLAACSRISALMCGKEIHAYVLRNGMEIHGFLPNALLDFYVRCGRIGPALNLFNMQKEDVTAWNILLTGYAQRGQGALAIELFDGMITSRVKPDEITFISLFRACSRSGLVAEGLDYLNSMESKYCIVPNLKHYACVVDLLGRAGLVDDAYDFIVSLPVKLRYLGGFIKRFWIEVKGNVHAFLSGDNLPPQSKEINAVLEGFYEKIKAAHHSESERYRVNEVEDSKAEIFCGHSERLAIAFGLINTAPGTPIWVTKNLYMCKSCHDIIKFISEVVRREISVRDTEHFHNFKDGRCTCGDENYLRET
ncbi:hypothetical protein RND71_017200 [Anisodus tanguticus]|uniref:DYW domain-containing protein n=1 Tax=Anisodus tanguticus TaxID=243964 RepID=A0AAE1VI06_9SOLA|nr:hypothetical protein RND71_017200 [Anisodus tanguticus]